ncbi:ATP-binding protein [Thioclava sp. FR2]|uniref:ATP-binding protein n=1 Tax=Thioclava sp. FR2 TaxID=3445780 RepID=UPI003EB95C83
MNELIQSLISGIPFPALIIGQDERVSTMNDAAVALLGASTLGRHHALALRQPEMQAAITRSLTQAEVSQARHSVPGQTLGIIHHVTVTPLAHAAGVLCVFEDRTPQEQIELMRREFVANVSHELRSPLTALLGFIETLRGAAKDDPVARDRFLAIMEREAGRMNRLIQDLLNLSRVEADERVRPVARVDLLEILNSTISSLRPLSENSKVEIKLISQVKESALLGDADQLVQVFHNLIENAVKYGGAKGMVTVLVDSDQLPKSRAIRVDVIDKGDGMDPIHIPRLTERFYRVDGHRSREKGGTGLGLAIVKHIVQRHRGRLKITSQIGEGSTFSVILPIE